MAGNQSFSDAKKAKKDEFYTRREDIEAELFHYREYFKDKVIYCNCDDPEYSEFYKYFSRNFQSFQLKKLVATHYKRDKNTYSYKLEIEPDENGQFGMFTESIKTPINCNGDFRSKGCIDILKEADIVVTNPPFSLLREYIEQLMDYNKKFIVVGSQNAITYKEIFPLIKENKMWMGYGFNGGNAYFKLPPDADVSIYAKGVYIPEMHCVKFRNCCWFTNLDIKKRHDPLDLRGNYYKGNESKYPKYDNYNAIEVSRVSDIPCDYFGVIGAPITYLNAYCPEQFEIIWQASGNARKSAPAEVLKELSYIPMREDRGGCGVIDGKTKYARILIRRKPNSPSH